MHYSISWGIAFMGEPLRSIREASLDSFFSVTGLRLHPLKSDLCKQQSDKERKKVRDIGIGRLFVVSYT